ncbi:MAG: hypothetical protein KJN63_01305, partial [Acidimicrobiia bacterium]|nr:hypothetical protein [Acidimicrobiia bacterium]
MRPEQGGYERNRPKAAAADLAAVLDRGWSAAKSPVPALPLDLMRMLFGLIGLAYFWETLGSAAAFSSPDGFIDHEIVRDALWYTRLSALPAGVGLAVLRAVFALACVACAMLAVGCRPRLMAALLYVIAVSTYRLNFAVMYLDDATIHLVLFWLMLLPTGTTLSARGWWLLRGEAWPMWKDRWVSGLELRCFLSNIALLYFVAGLWKWTSPMWRSGAALYVGLQTPVSRAPDFWTPGWLPVLMVASWMALILEPLLPAMFVLRPHSRVKWALFGGALGLHLGILATLRIPYTNLVLISVSVVTFRNEIMAFLGRGSPAVVPRHHGQRAGLRGAAAAVFVALLSVAMLGEIAVADWRQPLRDTELVAGVDIYDDGLQDPRRAEEV